MKSAATNAERVPAELVPERSPGTSPAAPEQGARTGAGPDSAGELLADRDDERILVAS
jgi:hypothetical protein